MWNLIKNDPILKTIFIFILGIFAFSFAFSLMFGSGGGAGMEHEHGSGAAGYSAVTGLSQIIVLLSKIIIIVLLVAIIIVAVKFIKKHIIGNEPIKGLDLLKNKPIQSILIGVGGILLLVLALNILSPSSSGAEMSHAASGMTNNSFGFGYGLVGIATLLLRLLTAVSVLGMIVALVMYFKDRYFNAIKTSIQVIKETCIDCGTELKSHWQCCPSCGTEKYKNQLNENSTLNTGNNSYENQI